MQESSKQNYLHGAAIRAAGVVVIKILGAIYKIPLGNILGDEGYGYFSGHMHNHWKQYTLPLDNIEKVDFSKEYKEGLPGFYHFTVDIDETADTFLDFEGWGKGCVFVNGFNIGRFWEIGPQKRLYIPAPLLKKGENEIIVFETEGKTRDTIVLKDEPDIG